MKTIQLQSNLRQQLKIPLMLLIAFNILSAANGETSIARWQGNKQGAVSLTFDDGLSCQFQKAFPILQQHGLKATFFIISGTISPYLDPNYMAANDILAMVADGQEIGSHTVTHPSLPNVSYAQQVFELSQSQLYLQSLTGQAIDTFCYPYGHYDANVVALVRNYYIAARSEIRSEAVGFYYLPLIGNSFYMLPRCGSSGLQYWTAQAISQQQWSITTYHGIDGGYEAYSSQAFSSDMDYLVKNEPNVWVAPMGIVAKYVYEEQAASVTTLVADTNLIRLDLHCGLDSRFNVPLTLLTHCPPAWASATAIHAMQGQTPLNTSLVCSNGNYYVIYNALPDAGTIELSMQGGAPAYFTIGASADANGIISPAGFIQKLSGSGQIFTASANAGFDIDKWFVDRVAVQTGGSTYNLTQIHANNQIRVTFKPIALTISGYVIGPNGSTAIADVLMQRSDGGYAVTDSNGCYKLSVAYGWSGVITPKKPGYLFELNYNRFTNVTNDYNNVNCLGANTLQTFTISGHIKNRCNIPLNNVTVGISSNGWHTVTDANGYYRVPVAYNWVGTITPSNTDYAFEPAGMSYVDLFGNIANQDYIANDVYDLDCDGVIGMGDIRVFLDSWLMSGQNAVGDFNNDQAVNLPDFALFAQRWQTGN